MLVGEKKEEVLYDCVEFNGHIVGAPMKPNEKEVESDEDAYVFARDLDQAIKLFIAKAKKRIGRKRTVVIKEKSPWMLLEFPYCPYVEMEEKIPQCLFPKQNTICAITVPDGRAKAIDYPPGCAVCKMFESFYEEDVAKRKLKITQKKHKGVVYCAVA